MTSAIEMHGVIKHVQWREQDVTSGPYPFINIPGHMHKWLREFVHIA
jgi:hypothetical protein